MKNLLIDSNVFLEILLNQEKKVQCKAFLKNNVKHAFISNFSLHSIGVILLRYHKADIYLKFINDILPLIPILTLSSDKYGHVATIAEKFSLDFDDSYQTNIALENKMQIVTMDKDFKRVKELLNVRFLE